MGQNIQIINAKELTRVVARNPNASVVLYDPTTGLELNTILISTLIAGTSVSIPWLPEVTYNIPDIIEWNSKFWKTKVNGNLGNQPAENAFWTEVSASAANGASLSNWSAGVFTVTPCCVVKNNTLYILDESVAPLPFESTNFETELAANKWISGTVDLSNYVKRTGENLPILETNPPFYNYYATFDVRGVCPTGFHVPTYNELVTLAVFLGANNGGKLKETGFDFWQTPNTGATNEVGFNARGYGFRRNDGDFREFKRQGVFWTGRQGNNIINQAVLTYLFNSLATTIQPGVLTENDGASIRCLKDNNTPSVGAITDASGNTYTEVVIGTQIWLAQDLRTKKYNNGDLIPSVIDATDWSSLTSGAYSVYVDAGALTYKIVVEGGDGTIYKTDVPEGGSPSITLASQAEAESNTENTKYLSSF